MMDDAACAFLPSPHLLVAVMSIFATSPSLLVVVVRSIFCGVFVFVYLFVFIYLCCTLRSQGSSQTRLCNGSLLCGNISFTAAFIVQFSSVAQSCPSLCNPKNHSMPGLPAHHQHSSSLVKLMPIEGVMPSSNLILCLPLLLQPKISPTIRVYFMSQFFACSDQSIGVSASA